MSENNFKILADTPTPTPTDTATPTPTGTPTATPTPTATLAGGMTNLVAQLMGQYCFYDILNGKPSYKHKDTESYIYWKQGFWNIGIDRNLKGYVAVSSSLSEPPQTNWINIVGSTNFAGFTRPGYADPGTLSNLTVISMSECPAPTPTPTATPPGFTYPPTSTPAATATATPTATPTSTDIGPSPTPTGTPGASPTPTVTAHIPAGYLVSGTPLDIRCCGSMGSGGEVHLFWDGFVNANIGYDANTLEGAYIMFDDNLQIKSQVTPAEGEKIDHYAIEWIEIHQDDSVHAILSERKQICHYPGTNVASSFITIGKPKAAYAATKCNENSGNAIICGDCKSTTVWCLYRINYIQPLFKTLKYFGGLNWEAMKYIAGLTISKNGANGPIGANTSFYNGPHYRPSSASVAGAYNTGSLDSGNGMNVFSGIIANSFILEEYKNSGEFDIKNTIIDRMNLVAEPYNGGSSDPCCNAKDFEFMNGNCPKEPTNDWWIVPDCNCDRFPEDPGYGAGGPFGTEVECYRNTTCGSSFRCLDGKCQETYYGYYPTIVDCIVNCPFPRVTPSPSSPPPTSPPTIYYYKCDGSNCIDCEQNPSSCTDKDCDNPNYYCSTVKNTASQNCTNNCLHEGDCFDTMGCHFLWGADSWSVSSNDCPSGCGCRSIQEINISFPPSSTGYPGAILDEKCCGYNSQSTLRCQNPYPGFMFVSEDRIEW